ncbi:hemolysin-III channel protein-like protein Izh2 [Xylariomycetidae sp. FL2044]|nr:hemolysin-III channel protein-like protein Izh2 [Xylariomycetidae sp. FL2044]
MEVFKVSGFQALVANIPKLEGLTARGKRSHEARNRIWSRPKAIARTDEDAGQLLEWKDLSLWRQNGSEHLQTGYRRETSSVRACFSSWSYIHNETVNIFSHVIGGFMFMGLPFYAFKNELPPRYELADEMDLFVCSVYFIGVAICFVISTLFHTLMSHSEAIYDLGIKCDYQGILLLMWGSTIPLVYYSFPCHHGLQTVYWTVTTVLAALCSLATFHPSIGGPHMGHVRAVLFGAFGFGSFLAPILQGIMIAGLAEQSRRIGLGWIGVTALCNGAGVITYAVKFPERYWPRTFDIWGASHQVMHVMVVFAALAYTKALFQAFDFHHQSATQCNGP